MKTPHRPNAHTGSGDSAIGVDVAVGGGGGMTVAVGVTVTAMGALMHTSSPDGVGVMHQTSSVGGGAAVPRQLEHSRRASAGAITMHSKN